MYKCWTSMDTGSFRQELGSYYGKANIFAVDADGEKVHVSEREEGKQYTSYVVEYHAEHTSGTDAPVDGTVTLATETSFKAAHSALSEFLKETDAANSTEEMNSLLREAIKKRE